MEPVTEPISPDTSHADGASSPHTAQFYSDDSVLIDKVSSIVGSTLGAGGAAIVMATAAHRDGIANKLETTGLDLTQARAAGRYIALDAAEILGGVMTGDRLDEPRFTDVIGSHLRRAAAARSNHRLPVAVFGEIVALLAAERAYDAAIAMEHCWNTLCSNYPIALHCAYPMHAFSDSGDGDALARICDTHAAVQPVESFTALPSEDERLRMIVSLQQKAQALEQEVATRSRAEQALQEQNRELQAVVAARDEFLAVAAHELRTPVTGLRGHAQLLLRNIEAERAMTPDRMTRSVATLERLSRQLSQLVGRLLDTTQIQSGRLRIDPAPTDLVALVRSVLAMQPTRETHSLTFEGPARLDATVDSVRFEQVIANLVDNAVKYSPDGGKVQVNVTDNGEDGIEISVTDSGAGIPSDERDAVFASFRKPHFDDRISGIGLGLFVSREIVEMHGGSVRIEAPDHPGTRLVVTLPSARRASSVPNSTDERDHFGAS